MKDGEKTYSMSQIAGVVGLHPNTVRKYDKYACAIADKIISESQKADLSKYKDSMRPLIERDMTETKKALIK